MMCTVIAIAFFILFVCALSEKSFPYCPVTSTNERIRNGSYFYYPIDVFAPPEVFAEEKERATECKSDDMFRKNHFCSTDINFCPVTKFNTFEALLRSNSHVARSSLCLLKYKLMNSSEEVNVIVSGGSVTLGVHANGCCVDAECNSKENNILCSWSYQLYLWMKRTFPAKINYYNIAEHGHSSDFMAEKLITRLGKANWNKQFSSSDLIFLDHSVNDNEGASAFAIENGFENLIRHLYMHSVPRNWPTLVVLDADPMQHGAFNSYNYSEVYEKISKYYDVPVWSYRDVALSTYSAVEQSQYSIFLNFKGNWGVNKRPDTHPPWFIHWFMADMYGAIMNHEMTEYCDLEKEDNLKAFKIHETLRNRTMTDLPKPLSASTVVECDNAVLDLDYDSITSNLPVVGGYAFEPSVGGWDLKVDKVGRPGGFIVDKNSSENSKVIFTLNITTKEFIEQKAEFQVVFQYLRSYDNGGRVQVTFCNRTFGGFEKSKGILDGLWSDWQIHKYSLPDKWSPMSRFWSYKMCENFPLERPTIEITRLRASERERGEQKFKLLSIHACKTFNDGSYVQANV